MQKIVLDLERMHSLPSLHKYLHQALELPEYYGANLDALYDCLTELSKKIELVVPQRVASEEYLGWYGKQFLLVLHDAAEANENLKVTVK